MGKSAHEDDYKNGLQEIKDNATQQVACSQQPADRNEAVSTYKLVDTSVSSSDFGWAEGTSGWNLTVAAKPDQAVDADGEVSHVAFVDGSRLLLVTTTNSLQVYAGGLFTFPSFAMKQLL